MKHHASWTAAWRIARAEESDGQALHCTAPGCPGAAVISCTDEHLCFSHAAARGLAAVNGRVVPVPSLAYDDAARVVSRAR